MSWQETLGPLTVATAEDGKEIHTDVLIILTVTQDGLLHYGPYAKALVGGERASPVASSHALCVRHFDKHGKGWSRNAY